MVKYAQQRRTQRGVLGVKPPPPPPECNIKYKNMSEVNLVVPRLTGLENIITIEYQRYISVGPSLFSAAEKKIHSA